MESLYFLIPLALLIIALAVKLLFWAINNGQYDDLETEGHRILFDEDIAKTQTKFVDASLEDGSSKNKSENNDV